MCRERTALWYVSPLHSDENLKLSFQDLSLASQKAANVISSLGVKKAVCILPKVPEWWIINIGTIRANVTLLPGTTQLQSNDILGRLKASGADCIIADQVVADKVITIVMVSGDRVRDKCQTSLNLVLSFI